MSNVITTAEFIKRKKELLGLSKSTKVVHVKRLGIQVELQSVSRDIMLEALNKPAADRDPFLIAEGCKSINFKDQGLRDELGGVTAIEAVVRVFNGGEIVQMSDVISDISGYNDSIEEVDKLIKN